MKKVRLTLPDLNERPWHKPQPSGQPLSGMTVLVVEDSHFASEALRMLCLRSGARIRRADTLKAAMRHLRTYRPTVLIVDMGLPDGNGTDLIASFAHSAHRSPAILAISGDPECESAALAAGAHAFLAKPIMELGPFQQKLLSCLPPEARPKGPRLIPDERVTPAPSVLQSDLMQVAQLLPKPQEDACIDYIAGFLAGVARSTQDSALQNAATALARPRRSDSTLQQVSGLVRNRLAVDAGRIGV